MTGRRPEVLVPPAFRVVDSHSQTDGGTTTVYGTIRRADFAGITNIPAVQVRTYDAAGQGELDQAAVVMVPPGRTSPRSPLPRVLCFRAVRSGSDLLKPQIPATADPR